MVKEQALHPTLANGTNLHPLRAKCLELYTQREPIVLMHADCPVAHSEGLSARAQVELHANGRSAIATLYQVRGDILEADQVGLSDNVRHRFAPLRHAIEARAAGVVETIDNRLLARMAKLAGAPESPAAGLELHFKIGEEVEEGQPIMTLHGENGGELGYALAFADANPDSIQVGPS